MSTRIYTFFIITYYIVLGLKVIPNNVFFSVGQIYDNNRNNRQRDQRLRCYTCSSRDQANCGDPFFSGQVAAKYCDQYSTNSVHMCFKAVKWCKLTLIPQLQHEHW